MMCGQADRPCSVTVGRASPRMKLPSCPEMVEKDNLEKIENNAGAHCFVSFL